MKSLRGQRAAAYQLRGDGALPFIFWKYQTHSLFYGLDYRRVVIDCR
jgi:hypothetical protein